MFETCFFLCGFYIPRFDFLVNVVFAIYEAVSAINSIDDIGMGKDR